MTSVIVVGMHRSGTSALTGSLVAMGLNCCIAEDLYEAWDNPRGHWESKSITDFNDRILRRLGGFWHAPPELRSGWWQDQRLDPLAESASRLFRRSYPAEPWIWKDPRLSLTLPFWAEAMDLNTVFVHMIRDPQAAARSLDSRGERGEAHGLALWETYVHHALANLRGRPVVTVDFAALMADPRAELGRVAQWLSERGVQLANIDQGLSTIDPSLQHQRSAPDAAGPQLLNSQRALWETARTLPEASESLPVPDLADIDSWSRELVRTVRREYRLRLHRNSEHREG